MPIAEYRCGECGGHKEVIHSAVEWSLVLAGKLHQRCPDCHFAMVKMPPTNSTFQLEGAGWAKDGYSK